MTVAELIAALQGLPEDAAVGRWSDEADAFQPLEGAPQLNEQRTPYGQVTRRIFLAFGAAED